MTGKRSAIHLKHPVDDLSYRDTKRLSRSRPVSLTLRGVRGLHTTGDKPVRPTLQPTIQHLRFLRGRTLGTIIPRRRSPSILIREDKIEHGGRIRARRRDLRAQLGKTGGILLHEIRHEHGARALAGPSGCREVVAVELEVAGLEGHPGEKGRLFGGRVDAVFREAGDNGVDHFGRRHGALGREGRPVAGVGAWCDGEELLDWVTGASGEFVGVGVGVGVERWMGDSEDGASRHHEDACAYKKMHIVGFYIPCRP